MNCSCTTDCKSCKRLGVSIARFGGGTILFFLGMTMLLAGQDYWTEMGGWILPVAPWIAGLVAALIFAGSGLCILFAWMRQPAFAKVGSVFLVAGVATLLGGGELITTMGGGAWPLFLMGFFCFGLAVQGPREMGLMWMSEK